MTCALALVSFAVVPAHAQIEAGQVIDDSTGAPLVGSRILLQHDTAGKWETVETTHTDAQGLFQVGPYPPGIYRIALLGKSDPVYFGTPDTLAVDSMQQREFALPVLRRSAASAYLPDEVEHQARSMLVTRGPLASPRGELVGVPTSTRATFVVDVDGTVDVSSLHISGGSPQLIDSIRQSMISRRYRPATIGGIPVRQVVEETIRTETRVERIGGR